MARARSGTNTPAARTRSSTTRISTCSGSAGCANNLLVALDCGALDEPELCADIDRHLRVWGRLPQLAMSYEWAPEFVDKWAWVLDEEVLKVSNFWRGQRGEGTARGGSVRGVGPRNGGEGGSSIVCGLEEMIAVGNIRYW